MCILMNALQQRDLPAQIINLKWNQLHTSLPSRQSPKSNHGCFSPAPFGWWRKPNGGCSVATNGRWEVSLCSKRHLKRKKINNNYTALPVSAACLGSAHLRSPLGALLCWNKKCTRSRPGFLTGSWDLETACVCCELPANAERRREGYPDINFRCQHGQSWHFIVQQHHYNMVIIWAWVWHLLQDLSNHPPLSHPHSRLQYQAVRANLCFVLVCLNRLDVTSACGMCPVFSCQSEARVSGRSVAGAVWIRG